MRAFVVFAAVGACCATLMACELAVQLDRSAVDAGDASDDGLCSICSNVPPADASIDASADAADAQLGADSGNAGLRDASDKTSREAGIGD
jgi:hypothetical protein